MKILFQILVAFYRAALSSIFGGACRFEPSCSVYAEKALKTLPLSRALKLIFFRILSCRPGGPFGFDPVPQPSLTKNCECNHGK